MKKLILCLALMVIPGCQQEAPKAPTKESSLSFLDKDTFMWPQHFSIKHFRSLVNSGDLTEASRYVNSALQITPENPSLHLMNGFVYEQMMVQNGDDSRKELVGVAYRTAHSLDPSLWATSYLLGNSHLDQGNYAEAQQNLADALILRPNDSKILYGLAFASYHLGDIPVAASSIRRALALCPKDPAILRSAIVIFSASSDFPKAQECLNRYKSIVGSKEADIQVVQRRINEWKSFHHQPKIQLTANEGSAEGLGNRRKDAIEDAKNFSQKQQKLRADKRNDVVYIDFYLLRSSTVENTSKGSNIMGSLAVILGGGTDPLASFSRSLSRQTLTGFKNPIKGSWTKVFSYSVTPAALAYGLNIANVATSTTEVIARPSICTLVGKPAYFLQGDQYIGATEGSSSATVASMDAGTRIDVLPTELTPSGLLVMEVTLTGSLFAPPPLSGKSASDQLVKVSRSKVTTTVKAFLGQTVMLGGLYYHSNQSTKSGVPLLQDIPILQYFFANNTTNSEMRSVIYLMTPRRGGSSSECASSQAGSNPPVAQRLEKRGLMSIGEYSNMYYVMKNLSQSDIFMNFRSGDLPKLSWDHPKASLDKKLAQLLSFLYF